MMRNWPFQGYFENLKNALLKLESVHNYFIVYIFQCDLTDEHFPTQMFKRWKNIIILN